MRSFCWLSLVFVLPLFAQKAELKLLDTVRQNLALKQNDALYQSTRQLYLSIEKQVPPYLHNSLTMAALEEYKKAGPEKTIAIWIDELDAALRAKDYSLAYRQVMTLRQLAGKKRYDETDHEEVFRQALASANNRPSYLSLSWLQVSALPVKEYAVMVDAGEKIWQLRDSEETTLLIAEPIHQSQQLAALAAFELGRADLAARLMLRSLQAPGRRWGPSSPDMKVAERLLEKQHRTAVIVYLEACLKMDWPNRNAYLKLWLDEMKLGKTPQLRFPPEALAVSVLD